MRYVALGVFFLQLALPSMAQTPSRKHAAPHTLSDKSLADMIDQTRACVVRIEAQFSTFSSFGTGFFVNTDGTVVTANHVVSPPGITEHLQRIKILVRMPTIENTAAIMAGNWTYHIADVAGFDASHDIAVLKLQGNQKNPFHRGSILIDGRDLSAQTQACILGQHRLRDGESVFVSGYPFNSPVLITTSGSIASSDAVGIDETSKKLDDVYLLDIHANHGNSGGPVFSRASGAVIGIQVGVAEAQVDFSDKAQGIPHGFQVGQDGHPIGLHPLSYNSGIAQVISVSHITQLLKQNGIGFESEH